MAEERFTCPPEIHDRRLGKPDRKRKLYVNRAKGKAQCFRCGYGTTDLRYLGRLLGVDFGLPTPRAIQASSLPRIQYPPHFSTDWTSPAGRRAWQYLRARHLDAVTIATYGIGYCSAGRYIDRVVVPIYDLEGTLINWVARSIDPQAYRRYETAPGGASRCFNLRRAHRRRVLLLCEGVFDALRIPDYGVALLGMNNWAGRNRHEILTTRPRAVLLALDPNTDAETALIARDLVGIVPIVRRVPLQHTDLGAASPATIATLTGICQALSAQEEA